MKKKHMFLFDLTIMIAPYAWKQKTQCSEYWKHIKKTRFNNIYTYIHECMLKERNNQRRSLSLIIEISLNKNNKYDNSQDKKQERKKIDVRSSDREEKKPKQ